MNPPKHTQPPMVQSLMGQNSIFQKVAKDQLYPNHPLHVC